MTALSKAELLSYGIKVVKIGNNEYEVTRNGRLIKQSVLKAHHKYGKTIEYPGYVISVHSRPKSFTAGRLIYAWFVGDVPDNYDVDHIDNDKWNNEVSNLQLLTRKQNLAKRFLDDPTNNHNQYLKNKGE